jgi:hypothetical protein
VQVVGEGAKGDVKVVVASSSALTGRWGMGERGEGCAPHRGSLAAVEQGGDEEHGAHCTSPQAVV